MNELLSRARFPEPSAALEITTMRPKPKNSAASTFLHDTFDRLFWS
jgi:hypothetical protein